MHLASGHMKLLNVTFLVADANLEEEDLLLGRPLLSHLKIDSRTLLENNRHSLDGTNYTVVHSEHKKNKCIRRLLLTLIRRL